MIRAVKLLTFICAIVTAVLVGGCAVAEQDAAGVGQQFQDGLSGRGKIVPNDPLSDSYGSDYN